MQKEKCHTIYETKHEVTNFIVKTQYLKNLKKIKKQRGKVFKNIDSFRKHFENI